MWHFALGDASKMKKDLVPLFLFAAFPVFLIGRCIFSQTAAEGSAKDPTARAEQLVVVRTPGWDAAAGTLTLYERSRLGETWTRVGEPCDVNVGSAGLAWGLGLHGGVLDGGPEKLEGDNRSPAGAYSLSSVFGYAPRAGMGLLKMPYLEVTSSCQCVDDVHSRYYNLVLDSLSVDHADWISHERMRPPKGDWYKWGIVIDQNTNPREAGRGSCIFLHVSEGRGIPTSGCTAMDEDRIVALIRWLDAGKHPVLVQLPDSEYVQLKPRWQLP